MNSFRRKKSVSVCMYTGLRCRYNDGKIHRFPRQILNTAHILYHSPRISRERGSQAPVNEDMNDGIKVVNFITAWHLRTRLFYNYAIKYAHKAKTSFSTKRYAVASAKILLLVIGAPGRISPSRSNNMQYFSWKSLQWNTDSTCVWPLGFFT